MDEEERRNIAPIRRLLKYCHEAGVKRFVFPSSGGTVYGNTANVPIHEGCLADVNLVFADKSITAEQVNETMRSGASAHPGVVDVVEDPIVSSDVIGNPHSLLYDTKGTIKAGSNTVKTLGWYESLGHAARLLDVVRLYSKLDQQQEAA